MDALLDTDHFSILQQRRQPACFYLEKRLQSPPVPTVKISIVSFQEQARGWLAWLHRARKPPDVLKGYSFLQELLHWYTKFEVLPFDAPALAEFQRLRAMKVRIGTRDLRIAAIANVHGATVLSRNLRDFRQAPGLLVEDWTVP
ncbi:MAG: type II toxin-antitoxin system VapC family toxin [Gemmataceae bacterium]|nr:type II toxin-antitoxin system VapC family toxin [Gemmataceae bacterium]